MFKSQRDLGWHLERKKSKKATSDSHKCNQQTAGDDTFETQGTSPHCSESGFFQQNEAKEDTIATADKLQHLRIPGLQEKSLKVNKVKKPPESLQIHTETMTMLLQEMPSFDHQGSCVDRTRMVQRER